MFIWSISSSILEAALVVWVPVGVLPSEATAGVEQTGESLDDDVGEDLGVVGAAGLGNGRNEDGTLVVLTTVVVVAAALEAESKMRFVGRNSSRSIGFVWFDDEFGL